MNNTLCFVIANRLLVITGSPINNKTQVSEVIDLDRPNVKCKSLGMFPEQTSGDVGGVLDGKPIVCGGDYKNCYKLSSNRTFIKVARLQYERHLAAAVVIRTDSTSSLWITGGQHDFMPQLTTELLPSGGGRQALSEVLLPYQNGLFAHCLTKINDNTVILLGGYSFARDSQQNRTWIYHIQEQENDWTAGPDLQRGRSHFACGSLMDSNNGQDIVVVTGGMEIIGTDCCMSSTELWFPNVNDIDGWRSGPELPIPLKGPAGVTTLDRKQFVLVGGVSRHDQEQFTLFRLQCFDSICQWSAMEQQLQVARSFMVTMLIPEELTDCSEQND